MSGERLRTFASCLLICWVQNPLTWLEHKAVSIALQKSIVPWLIAMLGIDYPGNTTADLVRQIVAAIVKRDNIKNLGPLYDALADEYPETANAIAEVAQYAAGRVRTSFVCFLSYH